MIIMDAYFIPYDATFIARNLLISPLTLNIRYKEIKRALLPIVQSLPWASDITEKNIHIHTPFIINNFSWLIAIHNSLKSSKPSLPGTNESNSNSLKEKNINQSHQEMYKNSKEVNNGVILNRAALPREGCLCKKKNGKVQHINSCIFNQQLHPSARIKLCTPLTGPPCYQKGIVNRLIRTDRINRIVKRIHERTNGAIQINCKAIEKDIKLLSSSCESKQFMDDEDRLIEKLLLRGVKPQTIATHGYNADMLPERHPNMVKKTFDKAKKEDYEFNDTDLSVKEVSRYILDDKEIIDVQMRRSRIEDALQIKNILKHDNNNNKNNNTKNNINEENNKNNTKKENIIKQ